MKKDVISITKAKMHNLKSISLEIPKNTLTVITGPSGSGKSSLAFDTIYVEGQRRYIESLSSYARQFLGQYNPPDVESITGLSPAIAIDQKTSSRNPRSTVGTTTEIFDYLRVLFARVGELYSPHSGKLIKRYTIPEICKFILDQPEKAKIQILAPIVYKNKANLKKIIKSFLSKGFIRFEINGEILALDMDQIKDLDVGESPGLVIDRLLVKKENKKRISDSLDLAMKEGQGKVIILVNNKRFTFSETNLDPITGETYPDLEPQLFSFNSPVGACPECNGLGQSKNFDLDLMVLDQTISINDGGIKPLSRKNSFLYNMISCIAEEENIDLNIPIKKLPKKFSRILLEGSTKVYTYTFTSENSHYEFSKPFPGLVSWLHKKYRETTSERIRKSLETYMRIKTCPSCKGRRLNPTALATKINNTDIMEICSLSIKDCLDFVNAIKMTGPKKIISEKLLKEIKHRLNFLNNVGLNYLSLDRASMTLSGGESQRIRLATQIGSALTGVLYVLDEPSIGLHQRDNSKLIKTLKSLRDLGNTVLVVEHDEETMMESDYIIDIGPGAGTQGGHIVEMGHTSKFLKSKKSLTAKYLTNTESIEIPKTRRKLTNFIKLRGATQNNVKQIDVNFPLGGLVCVTGVSGSGKSTLTHEVLVPACKEHLAASSSKIIHKRANYKSITGLNHVKSIIELDQSPIGRTPKSNPATYSGLFDEIRALLAKLPDSQVRGYKPGRFSFNVKGGRCEHCEGNGVKKIEMHFLPDVYVTCNECKGSRYNEETLSIHYKSKNISDILNMTIDEAAEFFLNHKKIQKILSTLQNVGLGYIHLGQPATTLSGGEAQRLKLSKELAKRTKGHCLYVLDEPTTGLHFQDIKILLNALTQLIDQGNTVLVIEHNLDVIKTSDHIIDLGPEGGKDGGQLVAEGTPEEVAKVKASFTGQYLKKVLQKK